MIFSLFWKEVHEGGGIMIHGNGLPDILGGCVPTCEVGKLMGGDRIMSFKEPHGGVYDSC
jgi:hypothetical protein